MSFRLRCVRVGSAFFGMIKRSMWRSFRCRNRAPFPYVIRQIPYMVFLSFLACETMVDYSPVRLLPLAWESPERCNLFGLLGNFQRCLQCGSEIPNKLWYFPLVNIRTAASVLTPYIFSPRFFGGCIIRLADWTCLSCFIGSADWDKGLPHR